MEINPSEITKLLKEQIKNFGEKAEVSEVGKVLTVGDGIARVYGLDNVQAGEMVEFNDGSKGMALNLESDNVGIVIFGDDRQIKEGDTVKLVRFGDPNMENRSDNPKARKNFRSRHSCDEKKSKLKAGYWSCKNW